MDTARVIIVYTFMIGHFFLQFGIGLFFMMGLVGMGLFMLRVLCVSQKNNFLTIGLAFFVSLSAYTASSVFLLFILPNPLKVLAVYSILYMLTSFCILALSVYRKKDIFLNKGYFLLFIKKYWPFMITLCFVVGVFFLGIYKTVLLDEWLHRPVVKFFIENNQFPLQNPYDFLHPLTTTYHYGMHIVVSSVENLFHIGVPLSLDVVKISIVVATFLLVSGFFQSRGIGKKMSLFGGVVVLFAAGSFFLFDGFTLSHIRMWGEWTYPFNYSLLYCLNGITWVNIPLMFALLLVFEDLFYRRCDIRIPVIVLSSLLIAGLFLISELFGVLLLMVATVLFIRIFFKKRTDGRILPAIVIFFLLTACGVYFGGGLLIKTLGKGFSSFSQFLILRSPAEWGYTTGNSILMPLHHLEVYLKGFFLECIAVIIFIIAIIRKNISLKSNLVFILVGITLFFIPFIFSTPFGDLNLYKLTHLGIFLVHIALFVYVMRQPYVWLRGVVIALFIFAAVPIVILNSMIYFGNSQQAQSFRCAPDDSCYNKDAVHVLRALDVHNPEIKYVFTGSDNDAENVVSLSNSYRVWFTPDFKIPNIGRRYVYISPESFKILDQGQVDYLQTLKKISEQGGYVLYVIPD